jgi:hypothetical protein
MPYLLLTRQNIVIAAGKNIPGSFGETFIKTLYKKYLPWV